MKKQSATLLTHLGIEQVKSLTSIVKETLALDYQLPPAKIFTAADLWNIQRQRKGIVQRRFIF